MIDTDGWATLTSPVCMLLAPADHGLHLSVRPAPDSDLTFMAIARAVVDGVPVSTLLAHRPRTRHLRAEIDRTAASLDRVLTVGEVTVEGATVARWVRGVWTLEEALTEEGLELLTRVVVPVGEEHVGLTVRVPAGVDAGVAIADAVVASWVILPAGG